MTTVAANNSVLKLSTDLATKTNLNSDVGLDRPAQSLKTPYLAHMSVSPTPIAAAASLVQQPPHTPATAQATSQSSSPTETAGTYEVIPHRLFVGGFPPETQEKDLRELFDKFGQVREVKVIRDTETGASKGYGFVTFETDEEARNIRTANERLEIDGRRLNLGPAMRRIHHNQRYTEMVTSPSPIFSAGTAAFPAFAQSQQHYVPLGLSVQQAAEQGYAISQPFMSAQGIQYVLAMPQQGVQYQQYATPLLQQAQPTQLAPSFAYTPSVTPQAYVHQPASHQQAPVPAYAIQQSGAVGAQYGTVYGQVDMTHQMQLQQQQSILQEGTPPNGGNNVVTSRAAISRTPTRFGGRSARRSIHASLTNNADEASVVSSQQTGPGSLVNWPQSQGGQQSDANRWQQMSQSAASGCSTEQPSYGYMQQQNAANSSYYAQPLGSLSGAQLGYGGQSQYDGGQYSQMPPPTIPLGMYSTGLTMSNSEMYGQMGNQQSDSAKVSQS